MYNFTVGTAHTYYVGEYQWLVHNACGSKLLREAMDAAGTIPDWVNNISTNWRAHHVIPQAQINYPLIQQAINAGWDMHGAINGMALPFENIDSIKVGLPSHRSNHPTYSKMVKSSLDSLYKQGFTDGQAVNELNELILELRDMISNMRTGTHLP